MPRLVLLVVVLFFVLAHPGTVDAYVGPGAGLTVIGTAFAFLASILLAIVGFVWYPLKKLWRALARRDGESEERPAHD